MGSSTSCIKRQKEKPSSKSKSKDNGTHRKQRQQQQQDTYGSKQQQDAVRTNQEETKSKKKEKLNNAPSLHIEAKHSSATRPKTDPMSHPIDFYRERNRCLRERRLFEDSTFPANDSSLSYCDPPHKRVKWLRPREITRDPHLFTDGHSRFDVVQGELGDCWMLAALASLTQKDELFYRVVPRDQSFTQKYAGIFHFHFWQFGKWVEVVIDDRLPTVNGELLYLHSETHNEFWSALLEKTYAKLHGSYMALDGGSSCEAFGDFTGGLTELINLNRKDLNSQRLIRMMRRGFKMGLLFECGIDENQKRREYVLKNGLITGHAYSITGMHILQLQQGNVCLLRIRNPWGNEKEWKGPWSDRSKEWAKVPTKVRQAMELEMRDDGEFWMSFEDFRKNFNDIEICFPYPNTMDEFHRLKSSEFEWTCIKFHGSWVPLQTTNYDRRDRELKKPEYRIKLTDPDPEDDEDFCTVIIAIMQKNRRKLRHLGLDDVAIGFEVYTVSNRRGLKAKPTKAHLMTIEPVKTREMTRRFQFPPGEYIISPFCNSGRTNKKMPIDYLLRIFTNGIIESSKA